MRKRAVLAALLATAALLAGCGTTHWTEPVEGLGHPVASPPPDLTSVSPSRPAAAPPERQDDEEPPDESAADPAPVASPATRTVGPPPPSRGTDQVPVPAAPSPPPGKVLYLTFDDGPDGRWTPAVLALLRRYHATATFFVVGREAVRQGALLRAIQAGGHAIGNHTWDHASLDKATDASFVREVTTTQVAVKQAVGRYPRCLRPPYGAMDGNTRRRARALGLRTQLWSADTKDWNKPGVPAIVGAAMAGVRPGAVILLHDGGGDRNQTVAALEQILHRVYAAGWKVKRLPHCR